MMSMTMPDSKPYELGQALPYHAQLHRQLEPGHCHVLPHDNYLLEQVLLHHQSKIIVEFLGKKNH